MRRLFVLIPLLVACGDGGNHQSGPPTVTYPHIAGVMAGRLDSGDFQVGLFDVDLDVQLFSPGTTGTGGHATGTLTVQQGHALPISGTYSDQGNLDLAGSGFTLTMMSDVQAFEGPYTGPDTSGGFSAMPMTTSRYCGTVAGDETGVLSFVVAMGQVRLVMVTSDRNSRSAGDVHAGTPNTVTVDGPELLHLDGSQDGSTFAGTWHARDHSGTWTASAAGCPGA
jgi:hypothetical protein